MGKLVNYICSKCGKTVTSSLKPLLPGCKDGNQHRWVIRQQESKTIRYRCAKCGAVKATANVPMKDGCPQGGLHRWSKMD
jgi:predicted  nucleic acid-binding Zn-ribbon protein